MYNIFYSHNRWFLKESMLVLWKLSLHVSQLKVMKFSEDGFFFHRNSLSSINVNSKHLKECNISVFWSISFVLVPKAEQRTRLQGPSLAVLVVPRIYMMIFF